jgi:O-antigen/teichoic acid export membrane protein
VTATPRDHRRLASSALVLSAATMTSNVLGYLLTIVAARSLPTADFGAFGALLALIIIGNVAALAVQATVARRTAHEDTGLAGTGLVTAALVTVLVAATAPVTAPLLRLDGPGPMVAVALALGGLAVAAVPFGLVQGREQFERLAALVLVQTVLRVGGGLVGILATGELLGTLVGLALGLALAAVAAWAWVRPRLGAGSLGGAREVLAAATTLLGFVLVTNVDVVLARALLEPRASGLYAAGSIITKVAFWVSQFVPLLAFPRLTQAARRERALRLSLATVGLIGAGAVGVAVLLAEPIVTVVAGDRYLAVAPLLGWFALLGSLLAIANVAVYAGIARRDGWTTLLVWVALAALVGGALALRPDAGGLVRLACAVAATLAAVAAVRELRHEPDPARPTSHRPDEPSQPAAPAPPAPPGPAPPMIHGNESTPGR